MAYEAANHFEVTGKGIAGVVETAGLTGTPVVSLRVDGKAIEDATLTETECGREVGAMVDAVPDGFTVWLRLILPEVNIDKEAVTFAGVAILAKARTSIGGPGLVNGVLHSYELRPVAGTASVVRT